MNNQFSFAVRNPEAIRQALLARQELALVDVREEASFATAHLLFAVNILLSRLEIEVGARIPRLTTPITLYDDGEGLALAAAQRHQAMGYTGCGFAQGRACRRISTSGRRCTFAGRVPRDICPASGRLRGEGRG